MTTTIYKVVRRNPNGDLTSMIVKNGFFTVYRPATPKHFIYPTTCFLDPDQAMEFLRTEGFTFRSPDRRPEGSHELELWRGVALSPLFEMRTLSGFFYPEETMLMEKFWELVNPAAPSLPADIRETEVVIPAPPGTYVTHTITLVQRIIGAVDL